MKSFKGYNSKKNKKTYKIFSLEESKRQLKIDVKIRLGNNASRTRGAVLQKTTFFLRPLSSEQFRRPDEELTEIYYTLITYSARKEDYFLIFFSNEKKEKGFSPVLRSRVGVTANII